MNTQKQHEESGCTNYLQHNADSCPVLGLKEPKAQTSQRDTPSFEWSNRNFADGWWKTFYYAPGAGFDTGNKVYYGRNDWRTEAQAIAAQEHWEALRAQSTFDHGVASPVSKSSL